MNERQMTVNVSIGDVIIEQIGSKPEVVVEMSESLQASHIVVDEQGN